ncbi:MAG: lysine--tRNA ligase [Leptospiraceae bacterium]|nr:lysine--tRNA ligase [Leptospiraceae bacterium]
MSDKKQNKGKSLESSPEQGRADEHGSEHLDLYQTRLQKLQDLQGQGQDPYAAWFAPTHTCAELADRDPATFRAEDSLGLAGRLRSRRIMGKAAFFEIEDGSGRLQFYANQKDLGEAFKTLKSLDLGDILGISGFLFVTKTGQTTLHIQSYVLLAKSLRPLPVVKEADGKVFDAFADQEQRYRMRYVDLIVNPDVRHTFRQRSRIISAIRSFLLARDYLEVETPMMHPIPGGAAARPFVTHHNALDMQLYLRIAPELYLKRLLVGGFERVFEINRNFRNEGISIKHNPEFTMLELYEAFGNMESMMQLFEDLMDHLAETICGQHSIIYGQHTINLKPPYERLTYLDSIKKYAGVSIDLQMTLPEARQAALAAGLTDADLAECQSAAAVAEVLFDERVEANLIQPVFITDFPTEISPLAKAWPDRPHLTQRFEPYIVGRELGNAFSELNDPVDQKERFGRQVAQRESGSGEGGYMDMDYIRALEYGMPPAGGMGIGIDRLVMLLTNSASIRDTILFPLLRTET